MNETIKKSAIKLNEIKSKTNESINNFNELKSLVETLNNKINSNEDLENMINQIHERNYEYTWDNDIYIEFRRGSDIVTNPIITNSTQKITSGQQITTAKSMWISFISNYQNELIGYSLLYCNSNTTAMSLSLQSTTWYYIGTFDDNDAWLKLYLMKNGNTIRDYQSIYVAWSHLHVYKFIYTDTLTNRMLNQLFLNNFIPETTLISNLNIQTYSENIEYGYYLYERIASEICTISNISFNQLQQTLIELFKQIFTNKLSPTDYENMYYFKKFILSKITYNLS